MLSIASENNNGDKALPCLTSARSEKKYDMWPHQFTHVAKMLNQISSSINKAEEVVAFLSCGNIRFSRRYQLAA
jgi:hypothetical protein